MVLSSGLRNVRARSTTIIVASAAVISLLFFLPLTVNTSHNALLQPQSVFAQQQGSSTTTGNLTAPKGNLSSSTTGNLSSTTTGNLTAPKGNGTTASMSTESQAFLPYDNPTYGISMEYPSDWTASTSALRDYTELIAFYSPLRNVSDLSQATLVISVIVYGQDISLQEYTNYFWTILNQSEQVDVRSSSDVTVAGYPGHRIVLAIQPIQNSTLLFDSMNTWTTIGNKAYHLTYEGDESAFNQHLPEVSRMLESLVITSNNNMTTTMTGVEN